MMTAADIPALPPALGDALRRELGELGARIAADPAAGQEPTARAVTDAALLAADDAAALILERLTRKVEVGRRLRAAYQPGFGSAVGDADAHPSVASYLAALFVHAGIVRGDWKFLNAALKMEDGILSGVPVNMPEAAARALRHVLGEADR